MQVTEMAKNDIDSSQGNNIQIENFTEENVGKLNTIVQEFVSSYSQKEDKVSTVEWLEGKLQEELPEKTKEEIQQLSREIIENVAEFDRNIESLNKACETGQTKESWFQEQVQKAFVGVSVNEYGNYLVDVDQALYQANTQMMRVITTQSGDISQCWNLDGFIAEQQHVNSFNSQAALENSLYRAEVLAPKPGETYGLNSFDVAVKEIGSGKMVHQYQFKYGKDAQATIGLLKSGTYNNQRIVVPEEQVLEVQKAFPGKSVSGHIGGTEKVSTISKGMTKSEAKEFQRKAQAGAKVEQADWNNYSTGKLALHLGKNAALAGLTGATLATGLQLLVKTARNEEIETNELVETALLTGADAGVKAAISGAMKVGAERGLIPLLTKATPIGMLTGLACVGVENAKILFNLAKGNISPLAAFDQMGRTTSSVACGLVCGGYGGTYIGAMIGSVIPVVGTFVGGMVGYAAGTAVGDAIYSTGKAIAKGAISLAQSAYSTVKSGIKEVRSLVSSAWEWLTS